MLPAVKNPSYKSVNSSAIRSLIPNLIPPLVKVVLPSPKKSTSSIKLTDKNIYP